MRLRQIALVGLVLGLTLAGFFSARALGERDARRDSEHRADVAAAEIRARIEQGAALTESVRRFLVSERGVTSEEFESVASRYPAGFPASAWVEQVPASRRPAYERRIGRPIVTRDRRGRTAPVEARSSYLPASLTSGIPPMTEPGIDLGVESGVATAVERARTLFEVTATPLTTLRDGTRGLFLVVSAQRLRRGVVEPGFVVLFASDSWLRAAATETGPLRLRTGRTSSGDLEGAEPVGSTFSEAGQRFDVLVPRGSVRGAAALLPWIIAVAGLVLAALAGMLGLNAARRARTQRELDRIFSLSSDLIAVAGFDGYFRRVNPAVESILGYTQEEFLARPYLERVHPDDRDRTAAEAEAIATGRTTISFENRYLCKDGSYRWLEWTSTPVPEERMMYGVARDVTERRQGETHLREAEERTRALAEEQAALRRVATLVARRVAPEVLFAAVAEEVGQLLPVTSAAMGRYDPDGLFTTVAAWSAGSVAFPVGRRWVPEGKNVTTLVLETGRPARIDDFADASGPVGVAAREAGYRSAVGTPIIVEGHLWGVMSAASSTEALPSHTEARLASFTELVATAIANTESRAALGQLAEEQAALRRVATLVAQVAPPAELFSAVSEEVGQLFGADQSAVGRFEPDGSAIVLVGAAPAIEGMPIGTRWTLDDALASTEVFHTGRSARFDQRDLTSADESVAAVLGSLALVSTVAVPISVQDQVWGAMTVSTKDEPLPPDTEERLGQFTALVANAIANADSREAVARLADEQAALRRVATLVARGAPPEEVFAAVVQEVGRLLPVEFAGVGRFEPDRTFTVVATSRAVGDRFAVGGQWPLRGKNVATLVFETGRPARIDNYADASGEIGVAVREEGIGSAVAAPIIVEGHLWGVTTARTRPGQPLAADAEARLASFTELLATAIANAESRADLAASRARIVTAADETRRRIERDLHDGIQQRLVSLGLELRAAREAVPPQLGEVERELSRVADGLGSIGDELREISRGIHPAILSEGGLGPALRTLARRCPIPVHIGCVVDDRLPEPIEVAAYYVVSEALANATKHADASHVDFEAAMRDGSLRLSIRDDGVGGADPAGGSGLIGLRDRVEALGGSIKVSSPPGQGTQIVVQLPVELTVAEPGETPSAQTAAIAQAP